MSGPLFLLQIAAKNVSEFGGDNRKGVWDKTRTWKTTGTDPCDG